MLLYGPKKKEEGNSLCLGEKRAPDLPWREKEGGGGSTLCNITGPKKEGKPAPFQKKKKKFSESQRKEEKGRSQRLTRGGGKGPTD